MVGQLVGNLGGYSVVLSVASWAALTVESSAAWMDGVTVESTVRSMAASTDARKGLHWAEQLVCSTAERKVVKMAV